MNHKMIKLKRYIYDRETTDGQKDRYVYTSTQYIESITDTVHEGKAIAIVKTLFGGEHWVDETADEIYEKIRKVNSFITYNKGDI